MKKKKRSLDIVTNTMENTKQELTKTFNRIKPEVDKFINQINLSKNDSRIINFYPRNNTNIQYEPRLASITNTIYLDNDGDLYKKNKAKYCYSMHTAKIRLEIIKYLMDHADYSNAEDIREYTTSTSIKAVREAIRSINRFLI